MAERMTQLDLLLMMVENDIAEGEDLRSEVNVRCAAFAKRLLERRQMLLKALQRTDNELKLFDAYIAQAEPMPKVVQQGPKT